MEVKALSHFKVPHKRCFMVSPIGPVWGSESGAPRGAAGRDWVVSGALMVVTEGTGPGAGTAAQESAAGGVTNEVGPAGGFRPEA